MNPFAPTPPHVPGEQADPSPALTLTIDDVEALERLLGRLDEFLTDGGGAEAIARFWSRSGHLSPHASAHLLTDEVSFTRGWLIEQAGRTTTEPTSDQ